MRGGEDAVREQERVEEVDAEEAQVGETRQKPVDRGVTDVRHLARVERPTELDVVVVAKQLRIRPEDGDAMTR